MQFAFIDNKHEMQAFTFSIGVVVLSIIAVVSFALQVMALFYAFAVLAIALGFYMAYHLSKAPAQSARARQAAPARKPRKRRRS